MSTLELHKLPDLVPLQIIISFGRDKRLFNSRRRRLYTIPGVSEPGSVSGYDVKGTLSSIMTTVTPPDGVPCIVDGGMYNDSLTKVQLVCYRACIELRFEVEDTTGTSFHQDLQDITAKSDMSMFDKWESICLRILSECSTSISSLPQDNWHTVHDLLHVKSFKLNLSRQKKDVQVDCSGPSIRAAYNMVPATPESLEDLTHVPSFASTAVALVMPWTSNHLQVKLATMPDRLLRFKPFQPSSKDADTDEVHNAWVREISAHNTASATSERQQTPRPATTVVGLVTDDGQINGALLDVQAAGQ